MATIRNRHVAPEIINNTPCPLNHACLTGQAVCRVEPFEDREVRLLRCRDTRTCAYRKRYRGMSLCTCPVKRAAFGLN
jgi:hypothetical protein